MKANRNLNSKSEIMESYLCRELGRSGSIFFGSSFPYAPFWNELATKIEELSFLLLLLFLFHFLFSLSSFYSLFFSLFFTLFSFFLFSLQQQQKTQ